MLPLARKQKGNDLNDNSFRILPYVHSKHGHVNEFVRAHIFQNGVHCHSCDS